MSDFVPARIITIIMRGGNDFDVQEGERICDRLCWDEMLGQIASITHPDIGHELYTMLTPEEHHAREARLAAMRNPPPRRESLDELIEDKR